MPILEEITAVKGKSLFTTRPELIGSRGMVTSTHWLSAQAGMMMLERGGNAFDAGVAAAFVLNVVQPDQNGPGGEVPVIAHDAGSKRTFVVNGQGPAPRGATPEFFAERKLRLIPSEGLLAACVPAMFGTLTHLLENYGTLRLRDVLEPAISYAEDGYPLTALTALTIRDSAPWFDAHWPTSAEIYLKGAEPPHANSRFANPELAKTFIRVLEEAEAAGLGRAEEIARARATWYTGFVAEAIAEFARTPIMDGSGEMNAGLLSYDDLASWEPTEEDAVTYDYHGLTVCKPKPWSQGPVFLQQLALLAGFDIADTKPGSAELVHLVVEAAKLAFADREAYYGDPDFVDVPLDHLLSAEYNAERRRLIADTASDQLLPGEVAGYSNRLPFFANEPVDPSAGNLPIPYIVPGDGTMTGDTVHIDAVDAAGNLVSITPSGGFLWGSPIVAGLGFPLSTRAQCFSAEPGLPNSIAPRKRPRTTLSPSLVLRDGAPYMAFGTPGGDMQDQWPMVFFLNHVHHGMSLQEAIEAPTWHTTHFPGSFMTRAATPRGVQVEARMSPAVRDELERRGHLLTVKEQWSLGMTSAVKIGDDGFLRAAGNPRGLLGYAVGR